MSHNFPGRLNPILITNKPLFIQKLDIACLLCNCNVWGYSLGFVRPEILQTPAGIALHFAMRS